jgi:anti-sigma B factor antagonist
MQITETTHGAVLVVKAGGPLIAEDAPAFKTKLLDAAQRNLGRIVLDASAIAYVDSIGIETLADLTEHLADGGRSLKLCGATPTVKQVLALTGWDESFEFFDDINVAVRSFL